jgi:hypothetical protein
MTRRILTYCAAFLTGTAVWFALNVVNAVNPMLSWEYPLLRLTLGMNFPGGGVPLRVHFLNHAALTWMPFLAAFLVSYALTRRKARVTGAVAIYFAFLIWSLGMVVLYTFGVMPQTIFAIGLAGTFFGGLGMYLWLVSPLCSD